MQFYEYQVGVPFGNTNYDVALGGSHDKTFLTPPNSEVINVVKGTVTDISSPSWGKQVTLEMDNEINGHKYFAYLHLSAVNPALHEGVYVDLNATIGWSGGCTQEAQYQGTSNPTGQNFFDSVEMSSQPQTGIALCDGPAYGGIGWKVFPPIDGSLDPQPVIDAYVKNVNPVSTVDYKRLQFETLIQVVRPVNMNTGIVAQAWEDYCNGKDRGYVVSDEFKHGDWNNNEKTFQVWATGYYEWADGEGAVFYTFNKG